MAYTIPKSEIIPYPPDELHNFRVILFEWIDNLHFLLNPAECVENVEPYLDIVRNRFLQAGWYGDGQIDLMWIPPFMLADRSDDKWTHGVTIWHVKQTEDGLSWLLLPNDFRRPGLDDE